MYLEVLIKDALKPAEINRVDIAQDNVAQVWLEEDQRSLAIGKMGQNIALASRLTGVNIQLVQSIGPQSKEATLEGLEPFEIEEQESEE